MLLIGLVVGLGHATGGFFMPVDALAYWEAGTSQQLYPETWSESGIGYLFYPPPVAQLSTLLQPLGWSVFIVGLMVATFGAFWYCARAWSLPLVVVGIPYFLDIGPQWPTTFLSYALLGNLQWFLAALSIVALRHPALWSVMLVTKVTSAIGWWWHPFRGEWRAAAVAAGVTAALLVVSVAASPAMWVDFLGFAGRNATMENPAIPTFPVPFGIRLSTAFVLLAWGARTSRPWTVPVAIGWALPALYGPGFLPFWVAAGRLRGARP